MKVSQNHLYYYLKTHKKMSNFFQAMHSVAKYPDLYLETPALISIAEQVVKSERKITWKQVCFARKLWLNYHPTVNF